MADKKFTFINRINGMKKELTTSEAARLTAVRKSLGTFMTNGEGFADDPDKPTSVLDEAMENSFMLGQLVDATSAQGTIYVVSRKPGTVPPPNTTPGNNTPPAPVPPKKLPGPDKKDPPVVLPDHDPIKPDPIIAVNPEDPLSGTLPGTSTGGDHVNELTAEKRHKLVGQIGIKVKADGTVDVPAFLVNENGFATAREPAAVCKTVTLHTSEKDREDFDNYAFGSEVQRIQQWASFVSRLSGSIPELFAASCEFKIDSSHAELTQDRKVFLQSTQFLYKARVVIHDYALTDVFVAKVKSAVEGEEAAVKLLSLLDDYGHFLAKEYVLGGSVRLTYSHSFNSRQEIDKIRSSFRYAARALFEAEGVPVTVESGTGVSTGTDTSHEVKIDVQNLHLEVVGGNAAMVGTAGRKIGPLWLGTVDQFANWKTVGFTPKSLVPIIDLLESTLRKKCKEILRNYLVSQLQVMETEHAGNPKHVAVETIGATRIAYGPPGIAWGADAIRFEEPLQSIKVTWGARVCGIEVKRRTIDGQPVAPAASLPYPPNVPPPLSWGMVFPNDPAGGNRDLKSAEFAIEKDDALQSVEVGLIGEHEIVNHLVFNMTNGLRHPPNGQYGGSGSTRLLMLTAPRIRGFAGVDAYGFIDFGLRYCDLKNNTLSPSFLRLAEEYLLHK